jgi:glycosyltransferase involved in cell wall biosynthesis
MKIAFVTNICAHYNLGTFELLAQKHDVDYYFFSAGKEWYWQEQHGYRYGDFHSEYLPGFQIGQTRVTPSLPWRLVRKKYDVYVKCINGRFALPVTYLIARLRRKPFILWTGIWMRLQTPMQKLIFPLTRHIYRHSDAIVVYGGHVKEYLVSEGVDPGRIFIAYHATDNEFYGKNVPASERGALLENLEVSAGQKVILYLGRLEESKGVEYLVRAIAQLDRKDAVLVLAGEGTLRARLENFSKELNIFHKVRFTGYISHETARCYDSIA